MKCERIDPMPEELAIAHEGRVAIFTGATNPREFNLWLLQRLENSSPGQIGMSRLAQLAAACEMSPTSYARQHSLLGVLRVAARQPNLSAHGSLEGEALSKRMGMVNQKKSAYVCLECVKDDLENRKFSWFRRTHHLKGVDWCPCHRTRLIRVAAKDPWSKLPQDWIQAGNLDLSTSCTESKGPTAFESRFSDIACTLLSNVGPFEVDGIRDILVARASRHGLRIAPRGSRAVVSDMVASQAPIPWLNRHWPELIDKKLGVSVSAIDKSVSQRHSGISGFGYVTALAAMWDEVEEPIALIHGLTKTGPLAPSRERKSIVKRDDAFWQGKVWETYIANEGRASAMAEQLGLDRKTMRTKMNQIGMPPLKDVGTSPSWRAFLRFEAGEDLLNACKVELAELHDVTAIIRQSCARVATAARTICSSARTQIAYGKAQKKVVELDKPQLKESVPGSESCRSASENRLAVQTC